MSSTTSTIAGAATLGVVTLDQATKQASISLGPAGWNEPGLNAGLSLGLASSSAVATIGAAAVGVAAACAALAWVVRHRPRLATPIALVVGGALSNLLDRPLRGGVLDFVPVGPIVANLADVAVVVGLVAAAAISIRSATPSSAELDPTDDTGR